MQLLSKRGNSPHLLTTVGDVEDDHLLFDVEMTTPVHHDIKKCSKKRNIHFCETVSVRPSLHVNDLTEEEINNTWYSLEEMCHIKAVLIIDLRKIIVGQRINNSFNGDDENYTIRGLEYHLKRQEKTGGNNKKANRSYAINAVLDEQDKQFFSGFQDPEAIRNIYRVESVECTWEAQEYGESDEAEAAFIHNAESMKNEEEVTKMDYDHTEINSNNMFVDIEDEDCSICSLAEEEEKERVIPPLFSTISNKITTIKSVMINFKSKR